MPLESRTWPKKILNDHNVMKSTGLKYSFSHAGSFLLSIQAIFQNFDQKQHFLS